MRLIGNVLWFFLTGLEAALFWFFSGIVLCVTVIGIPLGLQAFKLAGLILWPFGRTVHTHFARHPIANVLWIVVGGLALAISFFIAGLLWCITIIGIPFGRQCFKLAFLSLMPFGATVS